MSSLPKVSYHVPRGENAFQILGGFRRAAQRAGWKSKDISRVIAEATEGDYENLCKKIESYC